MNETASILIIDDSPSALALLSSILTVANYEVRPADSGELALAAIQARKPDLVLLDVYLGGIDGFEVLKRLKADPDTAGIPVILISGFAEVKDWVKGLQLGAVDYVSKPFQSEELLARVKTHMALSRVTLQLELMEERMKVEKLESLGYLAGGIAHDFNNLFGGIFGYIELAGMAESLPRAREYLQKAHKTLDQARALTSQLLTFSKGGFPVRMPGNLASLVREATTFALHGSNIASHFTFPPDLWMCNYDASQIGRAINSIVINARQAMSQAGVLTVVGENVDLAQGTTSLLPPGKYVRISFQDTGCGIPPENLSRIFDPFFSTKNIGSGLGLATAFSIIHKHEGEITVESELGKGAIFSFALPAACEPFQPRQPAKSLEKKVLGNILLMEDDLALSESIVLMLEVIGLKAVCVHNGEDALQALDKAAEGERMFSAALLDLTIPGHKGGADIIDEIRKKYEDLLVFATSGYSNHPIMANPQAFGFTGKLIKPFSLAELKSLFASLK